jgi:hypothetical protein
MEEGRNNLPNESADGLQPPLTSIVSPIIQAIKEGLSKRKDIGDVDENNHFTFLGNCGRKVLCLGKRD